MATSSAGGGSGAAAGHRSRLSQQVARQSPARQQRSSGRAVASVEMEVDEDAEGEEDLEDNAEDNGEVEDKELYCFCQKLSYGEVCPFPHLANDGVFSDLVVLVGMSIGFGIQPVPVLDWEYIRTSRGPNQRMFISFVNKRRVITYWTLLS